MRWKKKMKPEEKETRETHKRKELSALVNHMEKMALRYLL
jgi:hypothetical protein